MYNEVLGDFHEGLVSSEVSDPDMVRKYILDLFSESSGKLTSRATSYGENILNQFLTSDDPDYSLFGGKSEKIMALSLYCSMLPANARITKRKMISEKIWSERPILLSETFYNDLENGRAGIVLALTYFYLLRADDRIEDIISNLLLLMISDARFHKKSITWFRSDLVQGRGKLFRDDSDVIFALNYVNTIFRNEFLGILLGNILVDIRRFPGYDSDNIQQSGSVREVQRILGFTYAEQHDHNSELLGWFTNLKRLANSSIRETSESNFYLNGLTKSVGFSTLIKNNFFDFAKEIPSQVMDDIISELTGSCTVLNQYQILNVIRATRLEKEKSKFRIIFRRLRLRVEMIDKSEIFNQEAADNSTFYENCKAFAAMPMCDFFNVKFTINQAGMFYRLINSNWLYSYQYEKKRFIGCFSISRYDKSIFVNTELLDGFLPRLFMYLSGQSGCINQFKVDVLDKLNLEINDEHFRNRLLLLIRQGILVPA